MEIENKAANTNSNPTARIPVPNLKRKEASSPPPAAVAGATAGKVASKGSVKTSTTRPIVKAVKPKVKGGASSTIAPPSLKAPVPSSAKAPPPMIRELRPPVAKDALVSKAPLPKSSAYKSAASIGASSRTTRSFAAPTAAATAIAASAIIMPPKKKRKEYDVKGRLQDLEEQNGETINQLNDSKNKIEQMTGKLDESKNTIEDLKIFKITLENTVQTKEFEKVIMEKELEKLTKEKDDSLRKHQAELDLLKSQHSKENHTLTQELQDLKRAMESLRIELDGSKSEVVAYRTTASTLSANQFTLESSINVLKEKLLASEELVKVKNAAIESLETEKSTLKSDVDGLESKIREYESVRRSLHNTIQELKGNIRVFCRMRPLLGKDEVEDSVQNSASLSQISFPPSVGVGGEPNEIELRQLSDSASGKQLVKPYNFNFDRVFQPSDTQAQVFDDISQLVQSALDGYNVCIFAYGQTGSGKTFTMEGPGKFEGPHDPNAGMIPRAVQQIFTTCEALKEKGWVYEMEAQFLEIYNETLRDLLETAPLPVKPSFGGAEPSNPKKLEIKHDLIKGTTTVTEATNVIVTCPEEVFNLLEKASQNRAVAATNCNERSSRSHSVFTLKLTGNNSQTQETCSGVLNLIDLAGSERLSSSGSTGDRLKETQAINKSLSSLGDVISSLANKEQHVPFRNSKLTYLLQQSFGGNCKTLMFVNVSPLASSFNETLCSLRFATKVNACNIGSARKNSK